MTNFDPFQSEVLARINAPDRPSLFVEARAGSGKTTILIEACKEAESPVRIVAFNRKIADEFTKRLEAFQGASGFHKASTLHSLALQVFPKVPNKKLQVKSNKIGDLIKEQGDFDDQEKEALEDVIRGLRNHFTEDVDSIEEFIEAANFPLPEPGKPSKDWLTIIGDILVASQALFESEQIIDFDEMLYLPLKYGWRLPKFTRLFTDEVQDFNPVQMEWLAQLLSPASQLVCVGDPFQSIYGFRGASSNACQELVLRFGLETLLMPTTYRCKRSIVSRAQQIVSDITAPEWQQEGLVLQVKEPTRLSTLVDPAQRTFVLARTHAKLIPIALNLLRRNQSFTYVTDKLNTRLWFWLKAVGSTAKKKEPTVAQIQGAFPQHLERLSPNKREWAEQLFDVFQCLAAGLRSLDKASETLNVLTKITSNKRFSNLELSTIHGAKGREASTVVFFAPEALPSPFAHTKQELQQELNLTYIAITRAQDRLVFLPEIYLTLEN